MKKKWYFVSLFGNLFFVSNVVANNQMYFIELDRRDSNLLYNNLKIPEKTEWIKKIIGNKTVEVAVRTKEIESSDGMFQISCQIEQYEGFIANTQRCGVRFASAHTESSNKLNESFVSNGYITATFNESKDISEFCKFRMSPYVPFVFTSLEKVTLKFNNQDVVVPRFNVSCEQNSNLNPTIFTARGAISQKSSK